MTPTKRRPAPDPTPPRAARPSTGRLGAQLVLALLAAALAGCALRPAAPATPPPTRIVVAPVLLAPPPPPDPVAPLLNYHQALRRMSQGELLKELSGFNAQTKSPKLSLQTAMILMLTRGNGDLPRAQLLLDSVAASAEPEAEPLKPLSQLLASNCAEARRLAEHGDKLALQLKDSQRRNEQLSDMLEGLKAIERSLPTRPAASAAAGSK
ncbi:MAG: hypothetical protein V4462_05280 [Pseudomonadota bacterium]